jgi:hypothetical protein
MDKMIKPKFTEVAPHLVYVTDASDYAENHKQITKWLTGKSGFTDFKVEKLLFGQIAFYGTELADDA